MTPLGWVLEAGAAAAFVALLAVRGRRRRVLFERGELRVVEAGRHRELWLVRGDEAALQGRVARAAPLVSGLPYTDGFLLYPPPVGGAALYLGAGAGIAPRQLAALRPDARATVVDDSADVLEAARRFFDLVAGPRLAVERADGRAVLDGDGPTFDLIVVDAFGPGVYPGALATVEAFARARARLHPDGVLAVNLAGRLRGPRLGAVLAGLVEVFGARLALFGVPLPSGRWNPDALGNSLAFGFAGAVREPAPPSDPRLPWLAGILARRLPVPDGLPAPLRDAAVAAEIPIS